MEKMLVPMSALDARHILDGSKRYIFFKGDLRRKEKQILLYDDTNLEVLGEVEATDFVKEPIWDMWQKVKAYAGLTEEEYFDMFRGLAYAYCAKLDPRVIRYNPPKPLSTYRLSTEPHAISIFDEQ